MTLQTVLTDTDSRGVARVTLNRPDKHNAFDDAMIAELKSVFDDLAGRENVRAVVLSSQGRSFSAGADLGWMQRMADYDYGHNLRDAEGLAAMLRALFELPQPTVAKVQGAAFGGAVGLVSCCDMAIASEAAGFSLSEVKIGLVPATISPYVIRAMGERACRRYFTTGERFDASEALRLGLVSGVVPAEQLDGAVNELVESILGNGPQAVRSAKDLINDVAGRPIDQRLVEDTCAWIAHIRVSPEGQEGLAAFLEKRSPAWADKQ